FSRFIYSSPRRGALYYKGSLFSVLIFRPRPYGKYQHKKLLNPITGAPIPSGEFMAKAVDCDLFQDGEKFLSAGGQKGAQLDILPEGEYKINPHLFDVQIVEAIVIEENEVGYVESIAGKSVSRPGGNFGKVVECDNYQDAKGFLAKDGEKGPQIAFLNPGIYRVNTILFNVIKKPVTIIPGGKLGLIEATDGASIPPGRVLAKVIDGHNDYFDGEAFIKNGGEKGRQLSALMPGKYRINPVLFKLIEVVDWTHINPNQVGIVTVNEGKPVKKDNIAADIINMSEHNSFQDPAKYLHADGQKGLQQEVLTSGNYAINPWFATVEVIGMTEVLIGTCGVVTSYVGEVGEDLMEKDDNVNAKIVEVGKKGIWAEPLSPGLHPINTRICKITIVPTTQILLSWADDVSSAHKFDQGLKTIQLLTKDAFKVNMDVRVIIHIATKDAPKVVANLGTVENMIAQVLEPAISSHFRNAAQKVDALDLLDKRGDLQETAKTHIQTVLKTHNIESKDTMIAGIVLPEELTKTVTDRQLAEQEKKTYQTQKQAEEERKTLANATAQADMQKEVVTSERGVEIAKNVADAAVKKATGEKQSAVLSAEGKAEAIKINAAADAEATTVTAEANAKATTVNGVANAGATEVTGLAQAKVILEQGKSTAEAYKLQVEAMGEDGFVRTQVMDKLANLKLKLVPDVYIGGGQGTGGSLENFFGLGLLEKVTGKTFMDFNSNPEKEEKDPK
ncbi:MAG: band 7 protein, partial [Patescibacteria group bacterium]|nr:band 7 protein [Patescibacteria group bacterium]